MDLSYEVRVRAGASPVLPDGRVGLVWLSDGRLQVCGPETRPWLPTHIHVTAVGIRLSRGVLPAMLGVPATALLDQRVPLLELWGDAALDLADRLNHSHAARAQVSLLEEAVRVRRRRAEPVDRTARYIASRLALEHVPVTQLAREVGLSERQLHRRCRHAIGYPASYLARLLRLHRFLALLRSSPAEATLAALAADAGYADQAHLSRDCLALTGKRPSCFRRR